MTVAVLSIGPYRTSTLIGFFLRHKKESGSKKCSIRFRFQDASPLDSLHLQTRSKIPRYHLGILLRVAGLGIEPKFSLSESDVLPLDDPAIYDAARRGAGSGRTVRPHGRDVHRN